MTAPRSLAAPASKPSSPAPPRPSAVHRVEVSLKPEYPDPAGKEALLLLHEAGLFTARSARASRLYSIRAAFSNAQVQQAARELLCDPVTESYRILPPGFAPAGFDLWRIEVWLKDTVSDPVGESVAAALAELGLPAPELVRSASVYHVTGKCGRNHLEKAAKLCLANPVIHKVDITEASA